MQILNFLQKISKNTHYTTFRILMTLKVYLTNTE